MLLYMYVCYGTTLIDHVRDILTLVVVSGKFTSRGDATNILAFPSLVAIMRTNQIYLRGWFKYLPIRARGSDLYLKFQHGSENCTHCTQRFSLAALRLAVITLRLAFTASLLKFD